MADKEILSIVTPKKSLVLPRDPLSGLPDAPESGAEGTPKHGRRRPTKGAQRPSGSASISLQGTRATFSDTQ